MKVIAWADCAPQPWANGGGVTRELLAWPDQGEWRLRLSVAEIERDGPFSALPGVLRHFAVLSGAGVELHLAQGPQRLTPQSPVLAFDGGEAPGCTLLAGATRDLNLMQRGGSGSGLVPATAEAWHSARALRGVFTTTATTLHTPAGPVPLPAMSLAVAEGAAGSAWRLAPAPAHAWWFDWEP